MKKRESNFELLRILSMMMIIAHHYSVHGHFEITYGISLRNMIIDFLALGGKIGVILYIFITGYHMIHSQIKLKKLFKLEAQILFYSVLFAFLFYIFPDRSIGFLSIENIRQSFFPILSYTYWFATIYMVLYLFVPYINKLLLSLSQKEFIKFLTLGFFVCTLIPTFSNATLGIDMVICFIYFYSIGSYLRLYPIFVQQKKLFILTFLSYLFLFFTTIFFQALSAYDSTFSPYI